MLVHSLIAFVMTCLLISMLFSDVKRRSSGSEGGGEVGEATGKREGKGSCNWEVLYE